MSDKIRIVYFLTGLESGGTERQLAALLEGLDPSIYDKCVVCLSGFGTLKERFEACSSEVIDLKYRRLRHNGRFVWKNLPSAVTSVFRLYRVLRKRKPDILHTLIPVCNVMGALAGIMAKVPVLVSSRLSLGNYRDGNRLFSKLEDFTSSRFTLIHCKSVGIKDDVIRREPVDPSRLRVIYNGISIDRFNVAFDKQPLRDELGINIKDRVIGMVANLKHYKGHEEMLAAMPAILNENPSARLLLVGRDDGVGENLKRIACSGDFTENIIFAGERNDVPKLMQLMDVLVSASHEEGFSNTIIEAMASSLPVVATHVGGNVEQVVQGVTGLLVPPRESEAISEAVNKVLSNPDWGKKLGRNGYARVTSQFAQKAVVDQMIEFYREAIDLESQPS